MEQYISIWLPGQLSQGLGYHLADTLVQIGTVVEIGRPKVMAKEGTTAVITIVKHFMLMLKVASCQLKRT